MNVSWTRIQRLMGRALLRAQATFLTVKDDVKAIPAACLHRLKRPPASRIDWQLEGPFDSSYSLALVNRETARALTTLGHEITLRSTEGSGDFDPDPQFLQSNPDLAAMHLRSICSQKAKFHVTSRNLYPPRVHDMPGSLRFLHAYAWEETAFPSDWVKSFNQNLDGISVVSNHVRKILIDNGVKRPITVTGLGVDHWSRIDPQPGIHVVAKSFRFLHISSCFARKGVDSLLKAYGQAFSDRDDVTLIIKTFDNPHNDVHKWLKQAREGHPNFPDVVIIEGDYPDKQIKALYEQCQALVLPSRAEGFCLPLTEGILSGLAVITTDWGGQTDFCDETIAWMVDYQFQKSASHFELFDSVWAEPDITHLAAVMRTVHTLPEVERLARVKAGQARLQAHWSWQQSAIKLVKAAHKPWPSTSVAHPRVGWITTWQAKCGIATYSRHLIEKMATRVLVLAAKSDAVIGKDDRLVQRCWTADDPGYPIELHWAIRDRALNTLVIQFNYGLFQFARLAEFLNCEIDAGRTVIVMMHSTTDPDGRTDRQLRLLASALARCDRILVHSINDLNRLKGLGLVNNVTLFPHGILDIDLPPAAPPKRHDPVVIATYGFFLPHKGLLEMIQALAMLRDQGLNVTLRMVNARYPVRESYELVEQAHEIISQKNLQDFVTIHDEFLPDEQSLQLLSGSDLIVYPYQQTGESASGAVRYGLASRRPIAVTPLAIFDDIAPYVSKLPGVTAQEIASGVASLISKLQADPQGVQSLQPETERWRSAHRYSVLAGRLDNLVTSLRVNRAY